MTTLYALLVGINTYQSPITQLSGCVADVTAMHDFLLNRTASNPDNLKVLVNEHAHRQAVIDGIKQHLGQAGPDDIALLYYSGHGVQEPTHPIFYPIEPDRFNEALVCYNRRGDDTYILADKEIAILLGELYQNGAGCRHIVLIFDSCHSGSGSRDGDAEGVRLLEPLSHSRPIEQYYGHAELTERAKSSGDTSTHTLSGWLGFAQSRHLLLGACRSDQLAREKNFPDVDTRRGVFTYYLLQTLQSNNVGELSYRELFQRLNALTRITVSEQSPQLEAPIGAEDFLDITFLDKTVRPRPEHYMVTFEQGQWRLDAGAVHGIIPPPRHDPEERTELALFDGMLSNELLRAPDALSHKVGTAVVKGVTAAQSVLREVQLTDGTAPATNRIFKAVIVNQPLPRLTLRFDNGKDGIHAEAMQLVREALENIEGEGQPSQVVRELTEAEHANGDEATLIVFIEAQADPDLQRYLIRRVADKNPVAVTSDYGFTPTTATETVENLEHIARYLTTLNLRNSDSPLEGKVEIEITIFEEGKPRKVDLKDGIRATAGAEDDPNPTTYTVAFKNKHPKVAVFCVPVLLDEKYEVFSLIPSNPKYIHLPAMMPEVLPLTNDLTGDPFEYGFTFDEKLHEAGVNQIYNTLKLFISTAEIDGDDLEQEALGIEYSKRGSKGLGGAGNPLARLMRRVGQRGMRIQADTEFANWTTVEIPVIIDRPLKAVPIPAVGDKSVSIGDVLTIEPHPALAGATVEIAAEVTATRDLGNKSVPPLFRTQFTAPFTFGNTTQSIAAHTSVLQLNEAVPDQHQNVTPDAPLRFTANHALLPNERLVAYGWDGDYYFPIGIGVPSGDHTAIVLEALTPPTSNGERSIGGSIKVFFQKVASDFLNFDFDAQRLAMLEVDANGKVAKDDKGKPVYETAPHPIAEAIKNENTKRILLLIHGWTGDTESMTYALTRLAGRYDVVLTFDYENLNTPVSETAQALLTKLSGVGISATKKIDIVGHSMGCFVSRWMIEKIPGGDAIVNRLVMLGAPNNGTNLATIKDLATTALFVGMNRLASQTLLTGLQLPVEIPPGMTDAVVAFLAEKVRLGGGGITATLENLKPNSTLLKQLRDEPLVGNHQIPYRVIAGDTDLIDNRDQPWQDRFRQWAFHRSTDLVFLGQPNDTTISVESQKMIPPGRTSNFKYELTKSDHISYFVTPDTLDKLVKALND